MDDLNTIQEINLKLLKEFDRVCKENDIPYYLSGGTALGAIRHKDFIPWDDDVDKNILREDFERLMSLPRSVWNEDFCFLTYRDFNNHFFDVQHHLLYLPYKCEKVVYEKAKGAPPDELTHCVSADIFVIDYIPKNPILSFLKISKMRIGYMLLMGHRVKLDISEYPISLRGIIRLLTFIGSKISLQVLFDRFEKTCRSSRKSSLVHNTGEMPVFHKKQKMEWYTDGYMHCTIRGEQFEITRHWDEYLRFCFGDYMELPPEEMRNPRHFFDKYR